MMTLSVNPRDWHSSFVKAPSLEIVMISLFGLFTKTNINAARIIKTATVPIVFVLFFILLF